MNRLRNPFRELEKTIGYRFRNRTLLESALTHRSFAFETEEDVTDNQRLEFLGDAVLDCLVAAKLFEEFAHSSEGVLTSYRSQITSGKALANVGRDIGLGNYLRMGKGEEASGGRTRPAALADALEALIAAAFVDGGIKGAMKVFKAVIAPRLAELPGDVWADNPKGRLQELCQRRWKTGPTYSIIAQDGPAHETIFTVEVRAGDQVRCRGKGSNKQSAERIAAVHALKLLGEDVA